MAEQNRLTEERLRRDRDDEERRRRRREEEDDWRRDDQERSFSRDESYGRRQNVGGSGEDEGYGGRGFGGNREYGGQRFGGEYGGQRFGGREYESPRHGSGQGSGFGERDWGQRSGGNPGGFGGYGRESSQDRGSVGRDWQQSGGSSQRLEAWARGEHRGKGPKGYRRSDERIREDVCDRLSDDDELDASEIIVTVKSGEVTLEGTVTDRRAKHRAEDLAESVSGVQDVDNKLRKNKGMLQEVGDRLTGNGNHERGGHAGSGTKNAPSSASASR